MNELLKGERLDSMETRVTWKKNPLMLWSI